MEQCIFCQSVYETHESTSNKPLSLCSIECERGFNEHQKNLESWLYTQPLLNDYK